jgi:hypothetical protein
MTELKDFKFESDHSPLTLQRSPVVAVSYFSRYRNVSCQVKLEAPEDVVAELRSCNQQYLRLGLEWKKKCEEARQQIRQINTQRANEIHELYSLLWQEPPHRR